jgi:hypothetical protein
MDATRISDGKPVMLKRLVKQEGPYELQINKLFSTEPLSSDHRNRCVQLLDVINLPDVPPIMVHPLLRPFYDPQLRTYGEFVIFYAQVCEVCILLCSGSDGSTHKGVQFMHSNNVAHRYVHCRRSLVSLIYVTCTVTAQLKTSCLIHQICFPGPSTLLR